MLDNNSRYLDAIESYKNIQKTIKPFLPQKAKVVNGYSQKWGIFELADELTED